MCSQILTGQKPSNGLEGNALLKYLKDGGRPSIPDDCPDYLRFCLESCWEYEPDKRPTSCDMWRMLRVAQLRSLGVIDENYDLFTYHDHNKNAVVLPPAKPQGRGSLNDRSLAVKIGAGFRCFLRKQNCL